MEKALPTRMALPQPGSGRHLEPLDSQARGPRFCAESVVSGGQPPTNAKSPQAPVLWGQGFSQLTPSRDVPSLVSMVTDPSRI